MIRLKIFDEEKTPEWYKDISEYYLPAYNRNHIEDFDEMKRLYEIYNNDLSAIEDDMQRLCNVTFDIGGAPEKLYAYNKIRNKFGILINDVLRRGYSGHKLVLLTAKAVRDKDAQLFDMIEQGVQQDLATALQQLKGQLEQLDKQQLEEFIQSYKTQLQPEDIQYKSFLTEAEIYKNKMLRWTFHDQDVLRKKMSTIEDALLVSRFVLYNGWKHGRPYIQVCNPLFTGWKKSPDEPFIHKGDAVWTQSEITIGEALDEYINKLPREDIEKLLSYSNYYNNLSADHLHKYVYNHAKFHATEALLGNSRVHDRGIGLHQGDASIYPSRSETIYRAHLEFRAYSELMFYTYTDEYNNKITVLLRGDANIIPNNASRVQYMNRWNERDFKWVWNGPNGVHEAVIYWVPRRFELTRLGHDINTDMQEVPFQPENTDNPYTHFTLSYKGTIINSRNAKSISLMQEALPKQMQIYAVNHLLNREIAKYQGWIAAKDVDQIPDELGEDEEREITPDMDKILNAEIIQRKTNNFYFSGGNHRNGLAPQNTRGAAVSVQQLGQAAELYQLQALSTLLDQELGIIVGVPPQREAQAVPGTNVRDNQQSLIQASLRTEFYYWIVDKIWNTALDEHLTNMDTYFKKFFEDNPDTDEHMLEYTNSDGTKELIRIYPEYLNSSHIGMFLHETSNDKAYFDFMMSQGMAMLAQNKGEGLDTISAAFKAITSGASVEEIHKLILKAIDEQQERAMRLQQQQAEMAREIEKEKQRTEQLKVEGRIAEAKAKEQERRVTELGVAEIDAKRFALQQDIDMNKINDDLQREQIKQDAETERKKMEIASKEKMNKEDNQTKLKQIKAKKE